MKSGSFPSISTVSASPTLFQGLLIICWYYCFNLLIHSFQIYVTSHDGYIAIFLKCTSDCLLPSFWSKANPKNKKSKNKKKYSSNLCSRAAMACRQAAGLCSVTLGICSHLWSTVNAQAHMKMGVGTEAISLSWTLPWATFIIYKVNDEAYLFRSGFQRVKIHRFLRVLAHQYVLIRAHILGVELILSYPGDPNHL